MTSQLLDPPAPPTRRSATEIPIGLTGWGIRVNPDGGGMIITPLSTDEIEKAAGLLGLEPENLTMLLIQPLDSITKFHV